MLSIKCDAFKQRRDNLEIMTKAGEPAHQKYVWVLLGGSVGVQFVSYNKSIISPEK